MSGRAQQNRGSCLCQFLPISTDCPPALPPKLYWFLAIHPHAMAFETNRGAALTGNYIGVGIFAMFNLACLYIDMSASVCIYSQYVAARMRALST